MTQNPLFDEVGISDGIPYKKGDWKEIAVVSDSKILGFFGEYRYLSNFHLCTVHFEGYEFPSSEHAYMFAKLDMLEMTTDEILKAYSDVTKMTPREVKKWGQTVKLRPDWEEVKYDIMSCIVFDKFYRNLDLRKKLLSTGHKYLEETLWWKDCYWGYDINLKRGQNNLGKILMKVREFWKK